VVASVPTITSGNNTSFTEASTAEFTVKTTGIPAPSLSESGALPSGVTFVGNGSGTAALGGTPAIGTAGTYPITITAANGAVGSATQSFTLTVLPAGAGFHVTTTSLPAGAALQTYAATLGATGGNPSYKWSLVSGSLPAGMKLHSSGSITGKPRLGGSATFTLQVMDHATKTRAPFVRTVTYVLVVTQPAPAITLVHPASGPAGGGNQVIITGSAFEGASSILFGVNRATVVSSSAIGTKITVTAPSGSPGTVAITIVTPGGSSAPATYTYLGP